MVTTPKIKSTFGVLLSTGAEVYINENCGRLCSGQQLSSANRKGELSKTTDRDQVISRKNGEKL
jgi:hypothetical protein